MALVWGSEFSVGIVKIDDQHKKLFDLINELGAGMRAGKGTAILGITLSKLIDYTQSHFVEEEAMMQAHRFPGIASHKTEHGSFVRKVGAFKADLDAGKAMLSIEVMNFLSEWLKSHIQKVDKGYSTFLNEKGIR